MTPQRSGAANAVQLTMPSQTQPALREVPERTHAIGRRSICIITENQSFGGMEVHTLGLMRALIDRGYEIELVTNRYHGYDDIVRNNGWEDRVRLTHTDLAGILYGERSDRRGWRQVLATLQSPVLVFTKGNNNYGQLGFLRECRRAFKKIVFIEHLEARERPKVSRRLLGVFPGLSLWWRKRKFLSMVGSWYADTIVAVSDKVRHRLVTDVAYAPNKVVVVRNGVPWQDFARDARHGGAGRAAYGIPSDAFVFGMLSRLSYQKRIDIALHALKGLVEQCPERSFYLVVAGEGTDADALRALAERLELQSRVKFIGFVEQPEKILSAFDVILFSSGVEGLPLSLLQGMAAECLPIVTRVSGMPEAVNSPDIGWVVAPDSPEELRDAMKQALLLDEDTKAQMRRNVLRRVREEFDIAESNRQLVEVCES